MSIDKLLFKLEEAGHYKDCLKTLKETSYDDINKVYLCQSSFIAYDFDCVTDKLFAPANKPKSFDALIVLDSCLYCVEFKNQLPSAIINSEIQDKLEDSQGTLKKLFKRHNIQKNEYNFIFFLVYKKPKIRSTEGFDGYKNHFNATTNKFNLESKLKNYFKTNKVITNDVEFLYQKYSEQLLCE